MDASAILAYVNGERSADEVERLLLDAGSDCLVHGVNLVEVYYQIAHKSGSAAAEEVLADLQEVGLQIREDLDDGLRRSAGDLRVLVLRSPGPRRGSIADSLCAALAERESCPVVTSDLRDFEPLVNVGRCTVQTFR